MIVQHITTIITIILIIRRVILKTMADLAAFILYRIFSILRTMVFSSTGRLYTREPKSGSIFLLAGVGRCPLDTGRCPSAGAGVGRCPKGVGRCPSTGAGVVGIEVLGGRPNVSLLLNSMFTGECD